VRAPTLGARTCFVHAKMPAVTAPVPEAVRAAARRALALPEEALLAECEETFFTAGGPGGQHRNKTESGVRLVHRPTGAHVTATERRSQARNRTAALERLRARLEALARRPKPRRATQPTRASKERRLREKKHRGDRKADRRDWD
jgi:ribosome-associated protein